MIVHAKNGRTGVRPFFCCLGRFYVLNWRYARPTPFGDPIFRCTFFTNLSTKPTTSGGDIFRCTFFTNRSTFPTPFGDSIFRCTAKDRGERRAKGIAIPLNPLELIVTGNRTCFVRTIFPQGDFLRARTGAFDAIKSAAALRLSPCLCVLHCPK